MSTSGKDWNVYQHDHLWNQMFSFLISQVHAGSISAIDNMSDWVIEW